MEQLNLFDIEHELNEEMTATTLEEGSNKKSVDSLKNTPEHVATTNEPEFQLKDKVKIILISEEIDSETHNYRKYYEPHLIGKVGEITKIHCTSNGKITYEVDVYGEKSIFEEKELVWIG